MPFFCSSFFLLLSSGLLRISHRVVLAKITSDFLPVREIPAGGKRCRVNGGGFRANQTRSNALLFAVDRSFEFARNASRVWINNEERMRVYTRLHAPAAWFLTTRRDKLNRAKVFVKYQSGSGAPNSDSAQCFVRSFNRRHSGISCLTSFNEWSRGRFNYPRESSPSLTVDGLCLFRKGSALVPCWSSKVIGIFSTHASWSILLPTRRSPTSTMNLWWYERFCHSSLFYSISFHLGFVWITVQRRGVIARSLYRYS